jgi:CBS domain-containing protein
MKTSDIMTQSVISVKKDTPLKEAAGLLAKFRIHGLPVLDDDGKVVGIIAESDFFTKDSSNIYLPTFLDFVKGTGSGNSKRNEDEDLEKITKVEDIMTHECMTVHPEQEVEELIQIFKNKNFNSLPVVDAGGKLVGIVTVMDVLKLL